MEVKNDQPRKDLFFLLIKNQTCLETANNKQYSWQPQLTENPARAQKLIPLLCYPSTV